MTVASSIFLIAVGAILRYAVTGSVSGFDIATAGLILMIAGAVGLIVGLFMLTTRGHTDPDYDRGYRDRRGPVE
ncbi:MAG: DUF6458 family protein [Thermoleophilaceae bacterium]